jgi:hypothetical protein
LFLSPMLSLFLCPYLASLPFFILSLVLSLSLASFNFLPASFLLPFFLFLSVFFPYFFLPPVLSLCLCPYLSFFPSFLLCVSYSFSPSLSLSLHLFILSPFFLCLFHFSWFLHTTNTGGIDFRHNDVRLCSSGRRILVNSVTACTNYHHQPHESLSSNIGNTNKGQSAMMVASELGSGFYIHVVTSRAHVVA